MSFIGPAGFAPTVTQASPVTNLPVPANQQVDRALLEGLFHRLRDDPPPWVDRDLMVEWLARYGRISSIDDTRCDPTIMLQFPAKMPGVGSIIASLQWACPGKSFFGKSSIVMQAIEGDGAAAEVKVRQAVQEVFGEHHRECSDNIRTAWEISDDMAIALVSPFYPSFAILIVNATVTEFDGCGKREK